MNYLSFTRHNQTNINIIGTLVKDNLFFIIMGKKLELIANIFLECVVLSFRYCTLRLVHSLMWNTRIIRNTCFSFLCKQLLCICQIRPPNTVCICQIRLTSLCIYISDLSTTHCVYMSDPPATHCVYTCMSDPPATHCVYVRSARHTLCFYAC